MPLIKPYSRNVQLKELEAIWGPMYETVLTILGGTGTVLPFGDPHHGQPNASTFKTIGGEQVTFTWSEAPSAFDTPLDLTSPDGFNGIVPVVTFNGSDEEADTPDATYWSRGDGVDDFPMSVGAWLNVTDTAGLRTIIAKWGTSTATREWTFAINGSGKVLFQARDDSAGVQVTRISDSAPAMGQWIFVVVTYDGAGGASAMDTVIQYVDGVAVASTAANNAGYVAMENSSSTLTLAIRDGAFGDYDGKMAGGPLGPFFTQTELSDDVVLRLYEIGRRALAL